MLSFVVACAAAALLWLSYTLVSFPGRKLEVSIGNKAVDIHISLASHPTSDFRPGANDKRKRKRKWQL